MPDALLIVVAVIAVASVGFLMLTGRINWRYGAVVILGCFILFGAAMVEAPNRMKLPRMTPRAGRMLIRPLSIIKPTIEIAMTAMLVATVPRRVASTQETAAASTLDPGGSASDP